MVRAKLVLVLSRFYVNGNATGFKLKFNALYTFIREALRISAWTPAVLI
jgi:hypothetical protein